MIISKNNINYLETIRKCLEQDIIINCKKTEIVEILKEYKKLVEVFIRESLDNTTATKF